MRTIRGQIVDLHQQRIFPGEVRIEGQRIASIQEVESAPKQYIMPGFVDAHVHIESSMLVPYEFARVALQYGTVATISDPHEIANVLGIEGVRYMIDNAQNAKLKFHFGAPSCVPATSFETAGAVIDSTGVEAMLHWPEIHYLAEMMNYPGVLFKDEEVMKKLAAAKRIDKPIDGHAPGLRGEQAKQYAAAGITTDHECFTLEEALDKLACGMKILIREGSAAKNYEALHSLLATHPEEVMFCSDDKHPDDLLLGHVDELVRRSLQRGYELFAVLRAACLHPVKHYNMQVGTLQIGDFADFIIVNNLEEFQVSSTFINGEEIVQAGSCILGDEAHPHINNFSIGPVEASAFRVPFEGFAAPVIKAIDGELITEKLPYQHTNTNGFIESDPANDILKVVVVNRYQQAPPAVGFIQNFKIQEGALASTVAHDSHNIICVGTSDEYIAQAVNLLVQSKGGLSAVSPDNAQHIPLPIAGLMSDQPAAKIGEAYAKIDALARSMGCSLRAPYMTLSFMALLVIPKIKLSDKGMFDAEAFAFY
ncbi:MAG: adenine deaminase [Bacteroidota bacterium]